VTTITLPSGLELSARLLKREHNGDLVGWFELWSSPVVVYRQKGRWTSKRYQREPGRLERIEGAYRAVCYAVSAMNRRRQREERPWKARLQ